MRDGSTEDYSRWRRDVSDDNGKISWTGCVDEAARVLQIEYDCEWIACIPFGNNHIRGRRRGKRRG